MGAGGGTDEVKGGWRGVDQFLRLR